MLMKTPLILWGGVDINPEIYGEKPHPKTQQPDNKRDSRELALIKGNVALKRPIVGVCRGAQLLCAFAGGKLLQHTIPEIQYHDIATVDGHTFINVPAGHHQIMKPEGRYEVLAWNPHPVRVYDEQGGFKLVEKTPEVVYYPDLWAIAIQPHPEWANQWHPWKSWINDTLYNLDIDFKF